MEIPRPGVSMIKWLNKLMMLMVTLMALAGCGGGGGESSGYTGKTTAAALTSANAYEMAVQVVGGLETAHALGGVAKAVSSSPKADEAIPVRLLIDIIEKSATGWTAKPALAKTVAGATSGTESGSYGSYSYSGTADPATGKFALELIFNEYQGDYLSPVISGSVSVSGTTSLVDSSIYGFTMVLHDLKLGAVVYRDSGPIITAHGKITLVNSGQKTIEMSVVFSEEATGKSYWYRDFVIIDRTITITPNGDTGPSMSVSGTFYHSLHGCVTVTTPNDLYTGSYGDFTSGEILLKGSNNSKARLSYTDQVPIVEVDSEGNGNFVSVNGRGSGL
jgi:hypothetical protein